MSIHPLSCRFGVVCARALFLAVCLQCFGLAAQSSAFGVVEAAIELRGTMRLHELRDLANQRVADDSLHSANDELLTAELLKQLGDPRAAHHYEAAIDADDASPEYELLYADYLRNFRGPGRPLFTVAEEHYANALEKALAQEPRNETVLRRIDRGLVALYQQDGLPLDSDASGLPYLFLSSVNRMARSTSDLDEVHDARDFTSEALFASSSARLNRPLTGEELRQIVRMKRPIATRERLRLRGDGGLAYDVFYEGRLITDAQIANFFIPGEWNDVTLHTLGISVEHTFGSASGVDAHWHVGYAGSRREGVVELLPNAQEDVTQADARVALSRFVGPDKLQVTVTYAHQAMELRDADEPPVRNRNIAACTGEYQVLRPIPFLGNPYSRLFAVRGLQIRGGVVRDDERYGPVVVSRRDYFAGASLRGLGPFDLTVQPGIIQSRVSGDAHQKHSQFRVDATAVVRLLDEDRQPGIPQSRVLGLHPAFLHLAFPYKRDTAREGLDAFENTRIGAELSVKLFRRAFDAPASGATLRARPATVLVTAGWDRQRFPKLDRTEGSFHVSVGIGD